MSAAELRELAQTSLYQAAILAPTGIARLSAASILRKNTAKYVVGSVAPQNLDSSGSSLAGDFSSGAEVVLGITTARVRSYTDADLRIDSANRADHLRRSRAA